jgi:PIN domain nuclease of toxin-antitoxin system
VPGEHVLDASALLVVLNREPGIERVLSVLPGAVMSAVNWSEVVQKALARGVALGPRMRSDVRAMGVTIVAYDADDAERAAQIWQAAPGAGLSLGDRACLALADRRGAPAVTADRAWADLPLNVPLVVVR